MSSIMDACIDAERGNRHSPENLVWGMTKADALLAVEWLKERMRRETGKSQSFPVDWLPPTGLTARSCDGRRVLAVAMLYLEKNSPIAVCGWCVANPANAARESRQAIRNLLAEMPRYARLNGARHLMTTFGNRGINRCLDDLGFSTGDRMVEHKFKFTGGI